MCCQALLLIWLCLVACLTTGNDQPTTSHPPAKNLIFDKKPLPVKKNLALLLLVLPLLLADGGCARRTSQEKKTRWYKHHTTPGGRIPCPTHDC